MQQDVNYARRVGVPVIMRLSMSAQSAKTVCILTIMTGWTCAKHARMVGGFQTLSRKGLRLALLAQEVVLVKTGIAKIARSESFRAVYSRVSVSCACAGGTAKFRTAPAR